LVDNVQGAQGPAQYTPSAATNSAPTRKFGDVQKSQRKNEQQRAESKKGDKKKEAAAGEANQQAIAMGAGMYERLSQQLGLEGEGEGEGGLDADGKGAGAGAMSEAMGELAEGGKAALTSGKLGKLGEKGDLEAGLKESFGEKLGAEGKREVQDQSLATGEQVATEQHADAVSADEVPGVLEESISEANESTGDQLKNELQQNLFASEVGNPLMAQRASEPKPVEAAAAAQQIPQPIVDRVVEKARFGMNADGSHEFQIDLKDDVFQGAEVKVVTKDGKVTVEMVSDDPNLHAAAEQLAKQLSKSGVNVENVQVYSQAEAQTMQQQRSSDMSGGGNRQRGGDRGPGGIGGAGGGASRGGTTGGAWSDQDVIS
jgi:hypothetical protein